MLRLLIISYLMFKSLKARCFKCDRAAFRTNPVFSPTTLPNFLQEQALKPIALKEVIFPCPAKMSEFCYASVPWQQLPGKIQNMYGWKQNEKVIHGRRFLLSNCVYKQWAFYSVQTAVVVQALYNPKHWELIHKISRKYLQRLHSGP